MARKLSNRQIKWRRERRIEALKLTALVAALTVAVPTAALTLALMVTGSAAGPIIDAIVRLFA